MKERITYLLPEGSSVAPSDIEIDSTSLSFAPPEQASEEWRVTLQLVELPEEVQVVLESFQELNIRWASLRNDRPIPPLVSRLPPGLNVLLTPGNNTDDVALCDLLPGLLGDALARCSFVSETCSNFSILSERSVSVKRFQYYQLSPINGNLVARNFLSKACGSESSKLLSNCQNQILKLEDASSIDIDFDTSSHVVTLTALWSANHVEAGRQRARKISKQSDKRKDEGRLEVGILEPQKAKSPMELTLGGYLTVVGEDKRPSIPMPRPLFSWMLTESGSTLFSFPSRHHLSPGSPVTFTATFQQPTGLHPKLQIKLSSQHLTPPKDTCGLYAYMTTPSTLFIDRYQLSDRLFLDSQNLVALRNLTGEEDLEAPEWVIKRWGSAALLELATPQNSGSEMKSKEDWTSTIPMHLRYIDRLTLPADASDKATIEIPTPIVFWACEVGEDTRLSNNPFDRTNLGYDGLFASNTAFYHVPPGPEVAKTVMEVNVPVLTKDSADLMVERVTLRFVAIGFFLVCLHLLWAARSGKREQNRDRKQK